MSPSNDLHSIIESSAASGILPAIGLICGFAALILAYLATVVSARQKEVKGRANKRKNTKDKNLLWQRMYIFLAASSITSRFLQSIRNRLEITSSHDERGLRRKSAMLLFCTMTAMALAVLLFAYLARDVLMIGLFTGMLFFVSNTFLDIYVSNVGSKILRQQLRFHELLRHKYYDEQSVDGAVEAACQAMLEERSYEMYLQGERLLEVLSAVETERSFEEYRNTAPNRYLKLLAAMCSITREYGDTKADNSSVFLSGIGHLSEEIRSELFKRSSLSNSLGSLGALTLIPMFLVRPIRGWAGESFAPMARFYDQSAGIILEVLMVVIAIVCHICVRKLQYTGETSPRAPDKKSWESRVFEGFLNPILTRLTPDRFSLKYRKLETLLKNAVSVKRVSELTCRRFTTACLCFVAALTLCLVLQVYERNRVLYRHATPAGFLGGQLSDEDKQLLEMVTASDRKIILSIPANSTLSEIENELKRADGQSSESIKEDSIRILGKMTVLNNNRFWWWKLIVCFLAFAAGWNAPVLMLLYQANVRAIDMEDEVGRFQTIVLMLMHMPRISIQEILEWMEMFSVHFREGLQTCLSEYSAGPAEALGSLKKSVTFEPMSLMISNLVLAATDLPILQAFEELHSEKIWSREKRRELNERIVERKKNLGNIVGFFPMYALIGLYLMLPMIIASMTEMQAFARQMSTF